MNRIAGFSPIVGKRPQILVLGSMPSVASLDKHEYYAKPQNAFWKIMAELYGAGPDLSYAQRAAQLMSHGVALWDVVASCERPGSLDSAIKMSSVAVNDFAGFFDTHATIRRVFFNGRKAEQLYRRRVLPGVERVRPQLVYQGMPSTSPAMASMSVAAKLEHWRVLLQTADTA